MATKTFYFKDAAASGSSHGSLQDGGSAPGAATTASGWVAATNAIGQACLMIYGTEVGRNAAGWGTTLQPTAALSTNDAWRSENTLNGDFANTDWTFTFQVRSVTAAYTGRFKLAVRVWRSTNATGSGATELTSARVASAATSANLSTSADTQIQFTWSPGAIKTLTNEYLFVNVGIEVTSAGGGTTQDVDFRVGSTATIVTSDFSPVAQALTPSLFQDSESFPVPTVTATYDLTPALFTNAQAYYTQVLGGTYDLTPALFDNSPQTFPAPTVAATYDLTPALFTNTQSFFTPTVANSGGGSLTLLQNPAAQVCTNTNTVSVTFASACTPGSRIIACVTQEGNGSVNDCGDPTNGSYGTADITVVSGGTGLGQGRASIYSFTNTANTALTVTVTFSGNVYGRLKVYEVSAASLDTSGSGSGTTYSTFSVGLTPTVDHTGIFSVAEAYPNTGLAADTNYTLNPTGLNQNAAYSFGEYRVDAGTAGAVTLTYGFSSDRQGWACVAAAYKASGGATQDLTPSLFTNSQTFYAPTVAATYGLTPSLFTNTQSFFTPTVSVPWSSKGFNFRATSGFVTDGSDEVFIGPLYSVYPHSITLNGDTFNVGWETPPTDARDRNSGIDRRLAGMAFVSLTGDYTTAVFRIDLPAAGDYKIQLAAGDNDAAQQVKYEIRDDTTAVITQTLSSVGAAHWFDASGVERTSVSDWVTNQVEVTKSFASTICRIVVQRATTNASPFSHFKITGTGGGASTQDLTPSLYSNSQTFYAPTVDRGAVGLTPSLYSNTQSFFTQAVAATYGITASRFDNTQTFFTQVVAATKDLTASRFDNTQSYFTQAVAATYGITASRFDNSQTFFIPVVGASGALSPSLFSNTQTFFTQTVAPGAVNLSASRFDNNQTFFVPTVSQAGAPQDLTASRFDNSQTFFTQAVAAGAVNLTASRFDNSQTFFTQVVAAGAVNLTASRFDNSQTFFTQVVGSSGSLFPSRFDNAQTFFTPTVTATKDLTASRFDNTQTFFTQGVAATKDLSPSRFDNAQTFYTPAVTRGAVNLAASRFDNAQTFYTQTVSQAGAPQTLTASRFNNAQTFFTQTVAATYDLAPSRFNGAQTFFTQAVAAGAVNLSASRFNNTQTFFTPTVFGVGGLLQTAPLVNQQGFFSPNIFNAGLLPLQEPPRKNFYVEVKPKRIGQGIMSPRNHRPDFGGTSDE